MGRAGRPSRKPCAADIARLEAARKAAGVTRGEIAALVPCTPDTLRRAVKSGLAYPRLVQGWRMALRTLTRDAIADETNHEGQP